MSLFITSLLLVLSILSTLTHADPPAFIDDEAYDIGRHGVFVELEFQSTPIKAPQLNLQQWSPDCETDKFFFIAPRGLLVGPQGPTIMDSKGHLIWHRDDFGGAYNLQAQKYKGQDVLTFWSGDDTVVGHGQGHHYMFDNTYQQIHKISAVGQDLMADLHEFLITNDNTALVTVYNKTRADMRYWGEDLPEDGWIWDCLFQEIDVNTNKLLFQWRASDHFSFSDCYRNPLPGIDGSEGNPFDWFHLNSVEKDPKGNYLISARYSHAVTYLSGQTGEILWNIGGKNSSFYDVSDGHASDFKWQHHARWHDDYTSISVFDNAAYFVDATSPARAMHISVNQHHMSVKLLREWNHPGEYISESQGSLQLLPNGNAFVGYGSTPTFAEFASDGELLCDAAFGALHWKEDGEFSPGAVMSYRAYKQAWTGRPAASPRVAFDAGRLYVSWNGDTRTATWTLDAAADVHTRVRKWQRVAESFRDGFETSVSVPDSAADPRTARDVYRLTATDAHRAILGSWIVTGDGSVSPAPVPARAITMIPTPSASTAGQILLLGAAGALVGLWYARRRRTAAVAPWMRRLSPRRGISRVKARRTRPEGGGLLEGAREGRLGTGEVRWWDGG